MKTITTIILLCAFACHFTVHAQDQKKYLYQSKVAKYNKMKNTGIGLTIGGGVLTVAGIVLMANGINDTSPYDPYSSDTEVGGTFALGYLATILGVTATGGGITLWAIGASKKRSYTTKLNSISLNLNPAPRRMVSLAYRF